MIKAMKSFAVPQVVQQVVCQSQGQFSDPQQDTKPWMSLMHPLECVCVCVCATGFKSTNLLPQQGYVLEQSQP